MYFNQSYIYLAELFGKTVEIHLMNRRRRIMFWLFRSLIKV